MRKYLFVILALFLTGSVSAGEDKVKMLFRDYKLADEDTRPLSAGFTLWENDKLPNHMGFYGSIAFFTYKDWRLEAGGAGTWNEVDDRLEICMLTGISVRLWDKVVVGGWYAPFWGLYELFPDDPWGIMVGYAFRTPGF